MQLRNLIHKAKGLTSLVNTPLALIAGVGLMALLPACKETNGEEPAKNKVEAPAAVPALETVPLQKGMLSTNLSIPGELIAFQQVDLYAKENSFVKKLYADVGSEVKAGQLLATMEAPELTSLESAAQSRLKSQEAIYIASKANYDRLLETSKTPGTVSQNDLDQALAKKNSDFAQWDAAKAQSREVADRKGYLEIRAPFNGVITTRNANPGAYVGPSGKGSEFPLFTLQEQKKLRLVIYVPEAYSGYLDQQDKVNFTVNAFPNEKFTAQVKRLAGALDLKLRSQRIEMDVANEKKRLLPGMVSSVSIPLSTKDSSFILPKSAVVSSQERVFVIRVVNGKAEWVDVKKGRENDGKVEVFGELTGGDTIVKTGSEEVRDGSAVNVKK
ncbi:efflux transporter periplasmic adaptor subunit [Niastella yeongjuensis]|uniref:Efflux transporter periplasmic adaptor subunit n=1 Tax=Niastella yeongjuensis TaxID=354355 RepID=A0A1V9F8B2_9BACT|nr:efflux RND transporter periplasmic adaptor subunit [Niastella yeongjuensis]OQP54511.1 efflux transporter periplasmic adaptor subunit [Niastella yeongjuensis]SEN97296.1 RND family efflux transporter, MFP subunit [Niastella yeongjuensis]